MKDNINNIRNQLIGKLDKLVQNTEQIYLSLGTKYPKLLQELDISIANSARSTANLCGSDKSLESIDLVIDEGDRIINQFNDSFTSMYSRDGELFEIIKRGVSEIATLEDVISNIKEGSIEMELISLNAMTVALKSGSAGKAFSFITDELKKLSAQTIKVTDDLTVNGKHQLELFEKFGNQIEETRQTQNELTSEMGSHLKSSFTTSSSALRESAEIMSSLSGSSKQVKEPLVRIMQEVQLQDIIRQSIDHIYISVDEFRIITENWSEEEKLDELAFRKMLPDLCISVLEEVKDEIEESCRVFETKSSDVKSILDNLEEERSSFISDSLGDHGNSNSGILARKEQSEKAISTLLKNVNSSIKKRLEISQEGINILKDIRILQRQFESFEPIITRFHNIIVASRIEVAKQAALADMRDTVKKMTLLTDEIDEDISKALDTIKHFLKSTENIINNYSSIIKREMPEMQALITRTTENQDRLGLISDNLMECLGGFKLFTKEFFSLFRESDEKRKKLIELSSDIKEIEMILRMVKENAEEHIFALKGNSEISDWSIQNERLNGIIKKFTIFTHKKTAADLAGADAMEVEEIADSGEVTLF